MDTLLIRRDVPSWLRTLVEYQNKEVKMGKSKVVLEMVKIARIEIDYMLPIMTMASRVLDQEQF